MPLKKTFKVLDKARQYLGLAEFTWVHQNGLPHDKPGGKNPKLTPE